MTPYFAAQGKSSTVLKTETQTFVDLGYGHRVFMTFSCERQRHHFSADCDAERGGGNFGGNPF